MNDRLWSEAVIIEAPGRQLRVESTRDAEICLRRYWPLKDGRALNLAREACQRALSGSASPDSARRAFVEAAREAEFEIRSWS
ncbi:DUF982 domain-containing protein [Metarhizobium album]|uniref:DUF982 domain-containing protein n=1 Tax=Metarhizobium album TaxID=2182425 RepID=A0A2U2DLW4_9HYPH|nr:DUF982 domain-containing protein [Rhizobium album]PWE54271.1 DUF982 domain-containing protein [Rhizobium album]